jgi:imidazoleglycerol phosphate synthase glutamine amidotransferase subunit HisH
MNVTIVDYNSGNISSVINSFKEVAKDKVNIEVTSDLKRLNQVIRWFCQAKARSRAVLMRLKA